MTKKVVVLQEDKNDCAAACVSSLIKYYNNINKVIIERVHK